MSSRPPSSRPDARKALAIGSDPGERRALEALLAEAEIELVQARGGRSGLKAFYAEQPDVVLLELRLEDIGSFEVLATIRELSDVPVVAVSEQEDGGAERVRALRSGADDCVGKPFSGPEMLARIEALLRRARAKPAQLAVLDDEFVHIDRVRHRVEVLGVEVALTPTEFRMLSTFAEHPGRVLGHGQLLEMVWGNGVRERDEVKLYVSYLRRKLGDAAKVNPVETVRGVGYRYRPRRSDAAAVSPG
ncbi:MAG TPA: response regulator transcription factor [Solirubrobacterales bacterium]|nr:response regulator transcription factor [Solirubrobacterales bacterium]